jgi:hypothetical protein
MPTASAVEELVSTGAQKRYNVLQIWSAARGRPESRGIQRSPPDREQHEADDAATDLEATRGYVSVRETIPREVEEGADGDGGEP